MLLQKLFLTCILTRTHEANLHIGIINEKCQDHAPFETPWSNDQYAELRVRQLRFEPMGKDTLLSLQCPSPS